MRIIATALVGITLLGTSLHSGGSGFSLTSTPGDADCDASLTAADALTVLRHVASIAPDAPPASPTPTSTATATPTPWTP